MPSIFGGKQVITQFVPINVQLSEKSKINHKSWKQTVSTEIRFWSISSERKKTQKCELIVQKPMNWNCVAICLDVFYVKLWTTKVSYNHRQILLNRNKCIPTDGIIPTNGKIPIIWIIKHK